MADDTKKPSSSEELARQARKDFDKYTEGWAEIRVHAAECMKAISMEGPWPSEERKARAVQGQERPCLHEDVLTPYINKVVNQAEADPIGITVQPDGPGTDASTANFEENRLRQIDYESNAVQARLVAFENAVSQGYGVWEIETDYLSPTEGIEQKICTTAAMDPWKYLVDPDCKKPDWSDMKGAFKLVRMSHQEFRDLFGDKAEFTDFSGFIKTEYESWVDKDTIQVAKWWRVENDGEPTKVGKRTIQKKKVVQRITNGIEILDTEDWPDYEVPVLVTTGRVKFENGVRKIESLISKAITGQLLYDYNLSAMQERINMVQKAKVMGPKGAFDADPGWNRMHREPRNVLEWEAQFGQNGEFLGKPEMITDESHIADLLAAKQSILIGIQNSIGLTSTERVDRSAKSGLAQQELKQDMNVNTYHFMTYWRMATQREGRIKERLLGKIEASNGRVGTRDIKGKHEMVDRTPEMVSGRHSVIISTGKAYQSQQQETKDLLDALMHSGDPNMQLAAAPNLIRMMNFGAMGEILAAELEAIQPPQMQQARLQVSGKGPDPNQQNLMLQQKMSEIMQLAKDQQKQIIDLQNEKRAKTVEMESRERQNADNNKTALLQTLITTSSKEDLAHLELTAETLSGKMDRFYQMLEGQMQNTHEMTMTDMDQSHEAGMAAADMTHQQSMADNQQQHEQGMQGADLAAQAQQAETANQGASS